MNPAARHDRSARRYVRLPILIAALLLVVSMVLTGSGLTGTTQAQAERGAIPSLTLDSNAPGQLLITWETPNPHPTDYRLRWANASLGFLSHKDSNEAERGNVYPAGDETTLTLNNLSPGEDYKVQLRVRYYDGEHSASRWSGPWTPTAATRVMDDPPAAPTGLAASHVEHNSLTLSWNGPRDARITGYRVLRGPDADSLSTIQADTGSPGTNYTDSTVEPETTYHYAVIALSQDGQGGQSPAFSVTTPAEPVDEDPVKNDPPAAPTGLAAARTGHSVVTLTWDDPQDDTITGYQILRGTEANNLATINSDTESNATEYQDDTVVPETTYHYAVLALSADGDGAQSTAISATTPAAPKSKEQPLRSGARQNTPIPPLVHPANTLVSNINHASSGTYTVRPHGDLAIQLPPPAPQESRYEDGWNLSTIKIRVSGVDAGEKISGRLHPGKPVQNNPGSSGPATGVGSSAGKPFGSVSVSPDGMATFSNPDPSGFNPKSQYFYFIISVNSGEIEVGKAATADLDAGTPNDLNLGPTWHRADNSWSADSTTTDRIQILITGSAKPVDIISPEPPPVPSRPSAPNDGVSTYRLGNWRSVNLAGVDEFGDAIHKVRLQKDTNYRVEFRTANSYASATAIDAGILVTNNLVDLAAVNSGVGSPFIHEVDEDGNPSTTLAKAISWFRYNTSSLEQGIWSNVLYQDFRTPNVLEAGGNTDCDAESEAKLVQETDCVYQFDYPTYYYLNIGTGIGVPTGEYGTMQFRISRTSDQTLGGMSRMPRDSEASFDNPGRIEDPVLENGATVDNKYSADGEIHSAGDVDWYIPRHSTTACSFSAAGRDLDGDIGTNDSASGLRMRAYDRNFGESAASSNRGSFRSSLSGVLPSDDQKLLEVTGTRAGGFSITQTCEAPPPEGIVTDASGNVIPNIVVGTTRKYFDDHIPHSSPLAHPQIDKYQYEVIDLSNRTSGSVTATISHPNDGDYFRLIGKPGRRYSITLTSVAATLATPGHPDGSTTRLRGISLNPNLGPYASQCGSVTRNEGTEPVTYKVPTTTGRNINEFDQDDNPQNIKTDLRTAETCMFIGVWEINQTGTLWSIGGYRITVRDEGVPRLPARADAHSPLMYDAEDVHLLRGDSPGMHVFITQETYTDGDGNSYPPSSSFGSIAGNGRIDSNDDIDLFRRRVSPGLYEVFIQSEAVRSRSYDEDKSNDAARLSDARERAHNNTLRAAFSVLEGSQGEDAGSAVDLTPGDDSSFDSLANPGTAICTTVRQESYVDEDTSQRKTRPTYECKATTIATFEAEYSGYYYVTVFRQYDQPNLGTYRVNMRAV